MLRHMVKGGGELKRRVASAARIRRAELGLSRKELGRLAGGLSENTIIALEDPEKGSDDQTITAVSAVLFEDDPTRLMKIAMGLNSSESDQERAMRWIDENPVAAYRRALDKLAEQGVLDKLAGR